MSMPRGQRLGRAIRTADLRLVAWQEPGRSGSEPEFELYDYDTDPLESRNLAAERPDDVARLKKLLATHAAPKPAFRQ